MTRGPFDARRAEVFGADPARRGEGVWPSDHGGLFAEIVLRGEEDDD
jgi:hypothetical protein